ncbi:hypothetical protein RRG08_038017 [Elysia crispata]|uniref:Uncharacterized protein n=1 Tax=Elysia crispata TaxID=231223 RepID=A0AAE1DNZ0_9GAST|nr:hypothetical protein RRG08_038017 [Elysia crispata]
MESPTSVYSKHLNEAAIHVDFEKDSIKLVFEKNRAAADRACLGLHQASMLCACLLRKVLGNEERKVLWRHGVMVRSPGTCSTPTSQMMMMCAPAGLD